MKRAKTNFSFILSFFLSLAMVFQGPAIAQPVVAIAINVNIIAKVTTHPDNYSTQIPLQMTGPVVSDLDCDWVLEVIGAGYNPNMQKSNIYVWHRKGVLIEGWPKEVDGKVEYIPAVGDMDGDGDLEIVVSVSKILPAVGGWVYAWHRDGSLVNGYPQTTNYTPGPPLIGDVSGGFSEEVIVLEDNKDAALCDINLDGKKEVITVDASGIKVQNYNEFVPKNWPANISGYGTPVVGDANGDGQPEIFLAIELQNGKNYIYGWDSDGSQLQGWPVNIGVIDNVPGNFLSLGDVDGDGIAEILTGSNNGWIGVRYFDGSKMFNKHPSIGQQGDDKEKTNAIYRPLVGDINNDGKKEILATSIYGNVYCYDYKGDKVNGWPYTINNALSQGAILVDIDSDSLGDPVNPANDLELLFSADDGMVHSIDLPGDFHPNDIQWGMYGFSPRNSGNYIRDWDTSGWTILDSDPAGATIDSVYDWNRGGRVIELKGAGLNNCYAFKKANGKPFDSKNSTLQWSMRYNLPFNIYVSIDTIKGKRYLYYTATDGNQLKDGNFIHHGLGGSAKEGRWHTFSRQLVQDLKDGESNNEIIDINAVYIQGSGRVDDIMLLSGLPCVNLVNLALSATVEVSSGDATKGAINDGNPLTKWQSDKKDENPYIKYTWDGPQKVNKIVIEGVEGSKGGTIIVTDSKGNEYTIEFTMPEDGSPAIVVFDKAIDDVVSIKIKFTKDGQTVSVGEIGVYYDPNVENEEGLPQEKYSGENYIQIPEKDGYFYDPVKKSYWLPHGIAYQTWNKALGQWQSPAELKSDLDSMVKAGANALRVDFVWKHIETADDVFDWSKYDMLLEEAQARGMKVFPIIGYQWPPDWFLPKWYTMHPQNEKHPDGPWQSDILSYEDPEVQEQFKDFLQAVVKRYSVGGVREDLGDTVAGWILGNEYGYLGLWSIEYDGYDPDCQTAFREWLRDRYKDDIGALNTKWFQDNIKTPGYLPHHPYNSFDDVDMPIPFGYEGKTKGKYLARDKASWYDLTEWREESIAKFVAIAAQAVKDADKYHLISYASVGMQWGEEDWRYHTEDARKIAKACDDIGEPLNFWSINNYPWGLENNELMTGQWGIERARHDTKLPVMITETGFTSTEMMYPDIDGNYPGIDEERQGKLIRNAVWEALESGAIGVCVFHWNDREQVGLTTREKGFGIVTVDKEPKPAYNLVKDVFNRLDKIDIKQYLVKSKGPKPDIAFLWDDATDTIVNRYQAEMNALFGTLERLGYEPTFINKEEFEQGLYGGYEVIVLPRNQKMLEEIYQKLNDIKMSGVKIHANADIPGIMNEYGEPRDKLTWLLAMKDLFGIDATNCAIDPNLEDNTYYDGYEMSSFGPINSSYKPKNVYYPDIGFGKTLNMWKYRDEIGLDGGIKKAAFDNPDGPPALVFHFDTAISLFSLGDNKPIDNAPFAQDWTWSDRYDWLKAIYMDQNGFKIPPELDVSNEYVLVDYRICADGSVLLSFKNYRPGASETTSVTTDLIKGKTVESLVTGEFIEENSDGIVERTLQPDGHDLLIAGEPDFGLGIQPLSKTINSGESASYTVNLTSKFKFKSPVNLGVSGLPDGATGAFSLNPVIPDGSTNLNISTTEDVTPGTYSLKIGGEGGGKVHDISAALTINKVDKPQGVPDFGLDVQPSSQTIKAGDSISYTINLTSINQFNSAVTLSVSGLPNGASVVFSPNPVTPNGSTILNISTTATTAAGVYSIKVGGTGGGMIHDSSATLTINSSSSNQGSQEQQNQSQENTSSSSATGTSSGTTSGSTTPTSSQTVIPPASAATSTSSSAEDEDESNVIGGPATVIILDKDKKKGKESYTGMSGETQQKTTPTPSDAGRKRTYTGGGYKKGGGTEAPQAAPPPEYSMPEIPPIEQFQKVMEEAMDREMGITRVQPKLVPASRVEEIIQERPKPKQIIETKPQINFSQILRNWISRIRDWWGELTRTLKFVSKSLTSKLA